MRFRARAHRACLSQVAGLPRVLPARMCGGAGVQTMPNIAHAYRSVSTRFTPPVSFNARRRGNYLTGMSSAWTDACGNEGVLGVAQMCFDCNAKSPSWASVPYG